MDKPKKDNVVDTNIINLDDDDSLFPDDGEEQEPLFPETSGEGSNSRVVLTQNDINKKATMSSLAKKNVGIDSTFEDEKKLAATNDPFIEEDERKLIAEKDNENKIKSLMGNIELASYGGNAGAASVINNTLKEYDKHQYILEQKAVEQISVEEEAENSAVRDLNNLYPHKRESRDNTATVHEILSSRLAKLSGASSTKTEALKEVASVGGTIAAQIVVPFTEQASFVLLNNNFKKAELNYVDNDFFLSPNIGSMKRDFFNMVLNNNVKDTPKLLKVIDETFPTDVLRKMALEGITEYSSNQEQFDNIGGWAESTVLLSPFYKVLKGGLRFLKTVGALSNAKKYARGVEEALEKGEIPADNLESIAQVQDTIYSVLRKEDDIPTPVRTTDVNRVSQEEAIQKAISDNNIKDAISLKIDPLDVSDVGKQLELFGRGVDLGKVSKAERDISDSVSSIGKELGEPELPLTWTGKSKKSMEATLDSHTKNLFKLEQKLLNTVDLNAPRAVKLQEDIETLQRKVDVLSNIHSMRSQSDAKTALENLKNVRRVEGATEDVMVKEREIVKNFGAEQLKFTYGHGVDGKSPFVFYEEAKQVADALKTPYSSISKDPITGGWFVNVYADIPTQVGRAPIFEIGEGLTSARTGKVAFNKVKKFLSGFVSPEYVMPKEVTEFGKYSEQTRDYFTTFMKGLSKDFDNVADDADLDKVIKLGMQESKWFSDSQLKGVYGLSDKLIKGYNSFRALNDYAFKVMNQRARERLVNMGYNLLSFGKDTKSFIGRELKNFPTESIGKYPIVFNGKLITDGTGVTKDLKKALKDGSKKLYHVDGYTIKDPDGVDIPVRYLITDSAKLKRDALPQTILNYVEGGRRDYADDYFLKANKSASISGKEYITKPSTLFNGEFEHMSRMADGFEELRNLYKQTHEAVDIAAKERRAPLVASTLDTLQDSFRSIVSKYKLSFKDMDEFISYAKELGITEKELNKTGRVFEVTKKGEDTTEVINRRKSGNVFDLSDPSHEIEVDRTLAEIFDTHGTIYSPRKEVMLRGADGLPAKMVDIRNIVNKQIVRTSKQGALGAYQDFALKGFYDSFAHLVPEGFKKTPLELLRELKHTPVQKDNLQQEFAQRIAINLDRQLNITHDVEPYSTQALMSGLSEVIGKVPVVGGKIPQKVLDKIEETDPLAFARGLAFHAHLGFYNTRQFLRQSSSVVNTLSVDPVNGTKALALSSVIKFLNSGYAKEIKAGGQLEQVISGIGKKFNLSKEQLRHLADSHRKLGYADPTDNLLYRNDIVNVHSNSFFDKVKASSTFFNDKGEQAQKSIAFISSYLSVLGNSKRILSEEELAKVVNRASALSGNMSKFTKSSMQEGVMGVITQMRTYNTKMMEQVFLLDNLTKKEKVKLGIGHILTFGLRGTIGGATAIRATQTISDWNKELTGEPLSERESNIALNGLFVTLANTYLPVPIDVSSLGAKMSDAGSVTAVLEGVLSGDVDVKSLQPVSGKKINNLLDLIHTLVGCVTNFVKEPTKENFRGSLSLLDTDLAKTISTWDTIRKVRFAVNLNKYVSRNNEVLVEGDQARVSAFLKSIGVDLTADDYLKFELSQTLKTDEKALKEDVNTVLNNFKTLLLNEEKKPQNERRLFTEIQDQAILLSNVDTTNELYRFNFNKSLYYRLRQKDKRDEEVLKLMQKFGYDEQSFFKEEE